jgi:hypothetical protein
MPLRHVSQAGADYYLILFDADGNERHEADGSLLSQQLGEVIQDGVTDVFFSSHGWKGDIPAAIRQYDSWVGTMAAQARDRELAPALDPDFKAMAVCIHWPSLPWGVEDTGAALLDGDGDDGDEFAAELDLSTGQLVEMYAARIADTAAARNALALILASADDQETARQVANSQLTPQLEAAYQTLFNEAGLSLDGPAAAPGLDHQAFTPATTMSTWLPAARTQAPPAAEPQSEQGLLLGGVTPGAVRDALLMPVRQLSFWAMKHRAVHVGETGVHTLLTGLQQAAPRARFHLMGHSFGCIVVSAAISGPLTQGTISSRLPRPVNSLFLVQGALSLWSFAERLPFPPNAPGYFRPIDLAPALVSGPIVTTQSKFDRAVGTFFPLGARLGHDLLLGEGDLPEYGGVGTFGIQGAGGLDQPLLGVTGDYRFQRGEIYNIDASEVIRQGSWPSGAHSDIAHPEIAHAFWQAALS